jgi:hypothetical protein
MKALSIHQPWASLIMAGIKPVENRTWKSNYRGDLLIHAGKKWDYDGVMYVCNLPGFVEKGYHSIMAKAQGEMGGIIGMVEMVDCVEDHPSKWFFGPYGFVFKDPRKIPFKHWPGRLSFFDVPMFDINSDPI